MWPTENNIFKNYHIKVLETTEQKVKVNPDGTKEVDTLHKKSILRKFLMNNLSSGVFGLKCSFYSSLLFPFSLLLISSNFMRTLTSIVMWALKIPMVHSIIMRTLQKKFISNCKCQQILRKCIFIEMVQTLTLI